MQSSLPIVVSPLVRIFERDGVDLVLVTVEAWPDEVVVRLRGVPTELTALLADEFDEALEACHRLHPDQRTSERTPAQPAERIFDFDVTLADDVGTDYSIKSSLRGGTGRMFRAEWFFAPGPPEAAQSLVVGVGGAPGTTTTQIELDSGH